MNALQYLQKAGWPHRECQDGEIAIQCPWCGYEKLDKSVSINADTGWGKCQHAKRCSQGGFNLYQLRKATGDRELDAERRMDRASQPKHYKKASEQGPPTNRECSDLAAEWFKSRGLDPVKAAATKLVQSGMWQGSPAVCFLYSEDGKVVDRKFRKRDGEKPDWKNFSRETDCPSLFGLPLVDPALKYLTITGGEMDTLAALQIGAENSVNGPSETDHGWIERLWDWLQGFDTFYIALDADKAGNDAAADMAKRLGQERCMRITFPDGCKDLCDAVVKGNWDASAWRKAAINAADFKPKKLMHLSAYVDEIFGGTQDDGIGDLTQFPTINRVMRGFRKHEMTLWPGDDKTGKSTFLANLEVYWATRGLPVCVGSFELSPVRRGRWIKDILKNYAPDDSSAAALAKKLPIWVIDHVGSINPDELLDMYVYAAKRYGVKHFVTDSLTMIGIDEDDYPAQAKFVKAIKERLVMPFPIHHHLVNHTRKGKTDKDNRSKSDSRGNAIVKAIHDNMIMIYRENNEESGASKTIVAIKSNREHGETKAFEVRFNQSTRTFEEVGGCDEPSW